MENNPKPWYKSRTMWFNLLNVVLMIASLTEIINIIPVEWTDYWIAAVAVGNILLRMDTSKPLVLKNPYPKDWDPS